MAILGVYDGHNACAALVSEASGEVLAAVAGLRVRAAPARGEAHRARRPGGRRPGALRRPRSSLLVRCSDRDAQRPPARRPGPWAYPHVLFQEETARIRRCIGPRTPEAPAATVQRFVEDLVLDLVAHYRHRTGVGTVAVAGGLFANVSLNRRLAEAEFVDSVYVHPAMSDAGVAVGAALQSLAARTRTKPPAVTTAFLGPACDEAAMAAAIRAAGFHLRRPPDVERCLARALALGEVVVRFDGRAEYGPRALGNRSILAPATDPALPKALNKRLQRSTVMPFAPATLAEHADRLYRGLSDAAFSSEFMTVAFRCTPAMADQAPAAVHLDGTARPQVVHAQRNPGLHAVLEHYAAMTGVPSVINTSLNLHEEPMVLSPGDAMRCAVAAGLSVAQIGPYLCGPDTDLLDRVGGLGP